MNACIAYNPQGSICANGFIQKPICSGFGACFSCRQWSERSTPYCMQDELPKHWIADDGSPVFYRPTPTHINRETQMAMIIPQTEREALDAVMRQTEADLASAHAEICRLQGLEPSTRTWPEWSSPANTLRWFQEIRQKFGLAP